jgi:flagellar biogenesis protein FliO
MRHRASMLAGIAALWALSALGQCAAWGQAAEASPPQGTASGVLATSGSTVIVPMNVTLPAATPAASPALLASQGPGGMTGVWIYLFLIVALLAGGLYFMRSGFRLMPKLGKGEKKLQITEMKSLGNRQFLVVAEYEDRKMLLGVCPGRIDYLSTLSETDDDLYTKELREKKE